MQREVDSAIRYAPYSGVRPFDRRVPSIEASNRRSTPQLRDNTCGHGLRPRTACSDTLDRVGMGYHSGRGSTSCTGPARCLSSARRPHADRGVRTSLKILQGNQRHLLPPTYPPVVPPTHVGSMPMAYTTGDTKRAAGQHTADGASTAEFFHTWPHAVRTACGVAKITLYPRAAARPPSGPLGGNKNCGYKDSQRRRWSNIQRCRRWSDRIPRRGVAQTSCQSDGLSTHLRVPS